MSIQYTLPRGVGSQAGTATSQLPGHVLLNWAIPDTLCRALVADRNYHLGL